MNVINSYIRGKLEEVEFPFTTQSTANILIKTVDGSPYKIDWGDGNVITYASDTTANYTYASPTSGVIKVISRGAIRFESFLGTFDFTNVSQMTNLERLIIQGNSFTGNMSGVSDLNNLNYLLLVGTGGITGDMSGLSNLTNLTHLQLLSFSFSGNMIGLSNLTNLNYLSIRFGSYTGDMSFVTSFLSLNHLQLESGGFSGNMSNISNLVNLIYLSLQSGNFTYNYAPLSANFGTYNIRLKANELSNPSDIDNILIDIDNNATVKSGNIDLRSNGAASPTVASASAITSLQSKGRTVLTN